MTEDPVRAQDRLQPPAQSPQIVHYQLLVDEIKVFIVFHFGEDEVAQTAWLVWLLRIFFYESDANGETCYRCEQFLYLVDLVINRSTWHGSGVLDGDETLTLESGLVVTGKVEELPEHGVIIQFSPSSGLEEKTEVEVPKRLPFLLEGKVSVTIVGGAHLDSKDAFAVQALSGFVTELF